MDFVVGADEVMWEAIYLRWVACGGQLDENGVVDALLSLAGTQVAETNGYRRTLLMALTNPINIDWVNQKAGDKWVKRHSDSVFSAN